jgi:hypothetical protein
MQGVSKVFYNGIPNVIHLLSVERWIVCTPLTLNDFVALATK